MRVVSKNVKRIVKGFKCECHEHNFCSVKMKSTLVMEAYTILCSVSAKQLKQRLTVKEEQDDRI